MKPDDIKNSIKEIKPDAYMKTRLLQKVASENPSKKRNRKKPFAVLSAVLCAAIIITGIGFGTSQSNRNYTGSADNSQQSSVAGRILNADGGVIIAYAGAESTKLSEKAENFASYPVMYKIGYEDARGLSEKEIEGKWKEIKKKFSKIEKKIRGEDIIFLMQTEIERLPNDIMFYQCKNGTFNLDIDNPEQVKKINVKTNSKYGKAEIFSRYIKNDSGEFYEPRGEELIKGWIRGKDVSLSGDCYAKDIAEQKKENINGYFYIQWNLSDALYEEFEKAASSVKPYVFDFTTVYDTMEFTVEYKNGDVAKSVVDINFDSDGNMFAQCRSYDYIENSK